MKLISINYGDCGEMERMRMGMNDMHLLQRQIMTRSFAAQFWQMSCTTVAMRRMSMVVMMVQQVMMMVLNEREIAN